MTHLESLELRCSNERIRLDSAKTNSERELRAVWVAQLKKEIAGERQFLAAEIDDDVLLAELSA